MDVSYKTALHVYDIMGMIEIFGLMMSYVRICTYKDHAGIVIYHTYGDMGIFTCHTSGDSI